MSDGNAARPPLYKRWYAIVLGAAALVGAISTLTGTARSGVDFVHDRFGGESAEPATAVVQRLRSGVQISEFQRVLGSPRIKRQRDQLVEYVFARPEFYVQALTRGDEVVIFSLTGRTKRFTAEIPQFPGCETVSGLTGKPAPPIHLFRTRFADLANAPDVIFLYSAARISDFGYSEVFGSSAACNLQFNILSYNPVGSSSLAETDAHRSVNDAAESLRSAGATPAREHGLSATSVAVDERAWDGQAADVRANRGLVAARRHLIFNTYTETAPNAGEFLNLFLSENATMTFGPSMSDAAVLSR